MNLRKYIKSYKDFPKSGVQFWDFSPLLTDPIAFKHAVTNIKKHFNDTQITHIAAIEAKGFTIGTALAYEMALPLILIRKPGFIPGEVTDRSFIKEYGKGEYQIKNNTVNNECHVLIVYDILAAAGASQAAIQLIENQRAKVIGCAYVIELEYLYGRKSLANYKLFSLVKIPEHENGGPHEYN